MKNIAVLGAGTMGNGIAHVFSQTGYKVQLIDISAETLKKAMTIIDNNLERMVAKGKISSQQKQKSLENIHPGVDIKDGVSRADIVIEAVSENDNLKFELFQKLDKLAPENAILATNTSSVSITKIASATKRPERVVGMHFMNPVPVMKLVEVIRGYNTSDITTDTTIVLCKKLGKTPVVVNDYPGFVANRILMPMINEAIHTLFEGVGGVVEIDTIMKLGMAHPMGPLQLADFIGLDVCLAILRILYKEFGNPKYAPCPLLVNMVTAGKNGKKAGEGFYEYPRDKTQAVKVSGQFSR